MDDAELDALIVNLRRVAELASMPSCRSIAMSRHDYVYAADAVTALRAERDSLTVERDTQRDITDREHARAERADYVIRAAVAEAYADAAQICRNVGKGRVQDLPLARGNRANDCAAAIECRAAEVAAKPSSP